MPMSPMYIWGPAESLSRSLRTCLQAELSGAHFFDGKWRTWVADTHGQSLSSAALHQFYYFFYFSGYVHGTEDITMRQQQCPSFISGFIALIIWTILHIFILKFGVYFWVHCIEG